MTTVAAIVLAVLALAVAVLALRRAHVVERRARAWTAAAGGGTAPAPLPAKPEKGDAKQVEALERRVEQLERTPSATALRHVAVVRYDAFDDVGGRLSFSAAVLDDQGIGLVLTAIHGRSETRSYLKQVPVTPESGQRDLSPEERQAVAAAMRGAGA